MIKTDVGFMKLEESKLTTTVSRRCLALAAQLRGVTNTLGKDHASTSTLQELIQNVKSPPLVRGRPTNVLIALMSVTTLQISVAISKFIFLISNILSQLSEGFEYSRECINSDFC